MRRLAGMVAALVVVAVDAAPPAADEGASVAITQAPSVHPLWNRCRGKWPPDPPGLGKRVAFTFDDGPSVRETPRVLEILRRNKVPAAFFMVGERVRGRAARKLVAEIAADPLFLIGNHTFTHAKLTDLDADHLAAEIDRAADAIGDAAGARPRWFRFPYSLSTCATADLVRSRGYTIAGWHVDSADWCFASGGGHCRREVWADVPDELRDDMVGLILQRVRDNDGGIILMHDIHRRSVDHLEQIIRLLREQGFRFVRLDDAAAFPLLNQK